MTGTVYIAIMRGNTTGIYYSSDIKWLAQQTLNTDLVANAVVPINGGNINALLHSLLNVPNANTTYSVWIVSENSTGVLQTSAIKLLITTSPCPPVFLLTGFPIPTVCVNKGQMAIFTIELPDTDPLTPGKQTDVNGTGIFAGTTWSLNWGDGTTNTYTSASDNDIPTDINFFTHVYNTASDCIYEVTLTTTNPWVRSTLFPIQ